MRHLAEVPLHEVTLLVGEVEPVEHRVQLRHPPVQRAVEADRVVVRGHQRGELLIDLLDLGRRIR